MLKTQPQNPFFMGRGLEHSNFITEYLSPGHNSYGILPLHMVLEARGSDLCCYHYKLHFAVKTKIKQVK